jgi:hypothetical protein
MKGTNIRAKNAKAKIPVNYLPCNLKLFGCQPVKKNCHNSKNHIGDPYGDKWTECATYGKL